MELLNTLLTLIYIYIYIYIYIVCDIKELIQFKNLNYQINGDGKIRTRDCLIIKILILY